MSLSFSTLLCPYSHKSQQQSIRSDHKPYIAAMNPAISLVFFLFSISAVARPQPYRVSNITVLGSVYCDVCSSNGFSKNSYFLRGAQVVVQCKFAVVNSTSLEEMSITAHRTTDRFGVYKLDIPPVDGLECREGCEVKSMCSAILFRSSSSRCNATGLIRSSTVHVAFKDHETGACYYNLNALSYKPVSSNSKCSQGRRAPAEGSGPTLSSSSSSSFIFWPIFPPVGIPWPISFPFPFPPLPFLLPPSLPFPFPHVPWPDPASLPFTIPSWLLPFLKPPFFPFPFPAPNPPPALFSEP